jgi:hypothetical protein
LGRTAVSQVEAGPSCGKIEDFREADRPIYRESGRAAFVKRRIQRKFFYQYR